MSRTVSVEVILGKWLPLYQIRPLFCGSSRLFTCKVWKLTRKDPVVRSGFPGFYFLGYTTKQRPKNWVKQPLLVFIYSVRGVGEWVNPVVFSNLVCMNVDGYNTIITVLCPSVLPYPCVFLQKKGCPLSSSVSSRP